MTDQAPPPPPPPPTPPIAPPPPPPSAYGYVQPGQVFVGKVRSTGLSMVLFVVTFGIYGLVWWYLVHEDMKKHSGHGIGGLVALLLAFFVSPAAAFFSSDEVGKLFERAGRPAPVSALTGLCYFP